MAASDDDDFLSNPFNLASLWLWRVCPPLILLFGTFGNVMTIVVFRRMSARQSAVSMSVYLIALAVSDLILLYVGLLRRWFLLGFGFDFLSLHDSACKVTMFLAYVSGMTSSFLLAALTTQRMISVTWPHRANVICTRARNVMVVVFIVIFFMLLNSGVLFALSVVEHRNETQVLCDYDQSVYSYYYFTTVQQCLDLAFTSVVPFCILIVSNSVLIWRVTRSVRTARTMTGPVSPQVSARERKVSSLTLTLITVSGAFLLLTLPLCVLAVYHYTIAAKNDSDNFGSPTDRLLWAVCPLLYYCNAAVNFYLYCLSGSRFRKELRSLLGLGKQKCSATSVAVVCSETPAFGGRSGI